MFDTLSDAGVVDVITEAARAQNVQCARELAAIGELYARRAPADDDQRCSWAADGHDNVVAEVAAALRISRGRAAARLQYAIALRDRLPRVAKVFARGDIDFRLIAAVVYRTDLVEDPELLAKLDTTLARYAPSWMRLSAPKLIARIDSWVAEFDPAGTRLPGNRTQDRYVEFLPAGPGLAGFYAQLHATDGDALDRTLDALAATVCRADPRTKNQRRADALGALAAGLQGPRCLCGGPECPAAQRPAGARVVLHVLAEQPALTGDSPVPGYLAGFGPLPAPVLRELAGSVTIKPLTLPPDHAEPGYRPSAALAQFIRFRDLTCRFPDCDQPAEVCDIDHSVPFPVGPTHASNLKLLCRHHHLLKTFWSWRDQQLADGTVIWTAPTGHTYTTKPFGALMFPALAVPTGVLVSPTTTTPSPSQHRTLMMPTRKRTRAQDKNARISWERGINEARMAADPPPF